MSETICVKCFTPEHCIEHKTCAFGRDCDIPYQRTKLVACDLGVGCDEAGVCYAAAHGEPEKCGRP